MVNTNSELDDRKQSLYYQTGRDSRIANRFEKTQLRFDSYLRFARTSIDANPRTGEKVSSISLDKKVFFVVKEGSFLLNTAGIENEDKSALKIFLNEDTTATRPFSVQFVAFVYGFDDYATIRDVIVESRGLLFNEEKNVLEIIDSLSPTDIKNTSIYLNSYLCPYSTEFKMEKYKISVSASNTEIGVYRLDVSGELSMSSNNKPSSGNIKTFEDNVLSWLRDFYNNWIKPAIDFFEDALFWFHFANDWLNRSIDWLNNFIQDALSKGFGVVEDFLATKENIKGFVDRFVTAFNESPVKSILHEFINEFMDKIEDEFKKDSIKSYIQTESAVEVMKELSDITVQNHTGVKEVQEVTGYLNVMTASIVLNTFIGGYTVPADRDDLDAYKALSSSLFSLPLAKETENLMGFVTDNKSKINYSLSQVDSVFPVYRERSDFGVSFLKYIWQYYGVLSIDEAKRLAYKNGTDRAYSTGKVLLLEDRNADF